MGDMTFTPILPRPPVDSPQVHPPPPPQIHRRSCTECCRRKVKCDRRHPCLNCTRSGSECVFPKSRRTPTRQKRSRDEELLKSLRRLERRLQSSEMPEATPSPVSLENDRSEERLRQSHENSEVAIKREESGRLVLDHDRSRYISNNFWANMSKEIEEMRDILDGSSASEQENDDDQEGDTPSSHFSQSSRGLFIFSPTADSTALQSLYPSSSDLLTMFDIFQQNVDPVARIFHCPTLRTTVTKALPLLDGPLDRHTGLVLFSISYAALTSLDDDECQRLFGEERRVMLPRYRYAVEQSLVRARFLDSQHLAVLASLVLFLLCVRRHDSSRFVSSLLGVVIRNAQAMGLHRDGTNFQLSPYETEMRRRVWWHICVLDLRASEDHGCDPSIYDQNSDTKFPLSINDEDISPSDTMPPPERAAGSDMIFCLLRFEVAVAIRRLNYPAPVGSHKSELSVGQKRRMVETVEKYFYERYIHRCDITKSFDWVSATWAKLMLAKMWLAVNNPLQPQGDSDDTATTPTPTPINMRSLAFEKSVEVLELSDLLETGHRAARWRWLFLTHFQWHAVVFVLAHLCVWPADKLAHRAWVVVDRVWERWSTEKAGATRGMLWKPIRRLLDRAQQIRAGLNSRHEAERNGSLESTEDGHMIVSFPTSSMARYEDPLDGGRPDTIDSNSLDQFNPHEHLPMQVPMGDLLDETLHSEWTEILHELQMGFQDGDIPMDLDAIQGYGGNFWNTL